MRFITHIDDTTKAGQSRRVRRYCTITEGRASRADAGHSFSPA
jgi:hypothetical protein